MSTERTVYYDDGNIRMVWEFYRGKVFIHLRVNKWGPSVYRTMKDHWPRIKQILARIGYAKIHAFYRESNKTMVSFASRFGFAECRRGGGFVLMENGHA